LPSSSLSFLILSLRRMSNASFVNSRNMQSVLVKAERALTYLSGLRRASSPKSYPVLNWNLIFSIWTTCFPCCLLFTSLAKSLSSIIVFISSRKSLPTHSTKSRVRKLTFPHAIKYAFLPISPYLKRYYPFSIKAGFSY